MTRSQLFRGPIGKHTGSTSKLVLVPNLAPEWNAREAHAKKLRLWADKLSKDEGSRPWLRRATGGREKSPTRSRSGCAVADPLLVLKTRFDTATRAAKGGMR